jgi:hypothetical protein
MPVSDESILPTTTDGRLRDVEVRIARMEERLASDREALLIARSEIDRRLEGMNELREQITGERGRYQERAQAEERHALLIGALAETANRQTNTEADMRAARKANAWLVAGATLFLGFVIAVANILAQ